MRPQLLCLVGPSEKHDMLGFGSGDNVEKCRSAWLRFHTCRGPLESGLKVHFCTLVVTLSCAWFFTRGLYMRVLSGTKIAWVPVHVNNQQTVESRLRLSGFLPLPSAFKTMAGRNTRNSMAKSNNKGPGRSQQATGNRNKSQKRPGTGKPTNIQLTPFSLHLTAPF